MFNNTNFLTNGESLFFNEKIKNNAEVIFDVGVGEDGTIFDTFLGEVHYFEPFERYLNLLKNKDTKNTDVFYNNFGLSDITDNIRWYPSCDSFVDRTSSGITCNTFIELQVKRADHYMFEKNIEKIDFLKIDVEGFEFNVIKGFDELIKKVKCIQFEYGGCYKDYNIKLVDVCRYLAKRGFKDFSYLSGEGLVPIENYADHYQCCNIVCTSII